MPEIDTETQEALEEETGLEMDFPYALRADQLTDGTYRYALENARTGEVVAEAIDRDDARALEQFRENLNDTDLTPQARDALRGALAEYERGSAS